MLRCLRIPTVVLFCIISISFPGNAKYTYNTPVSGLYLEVRKAERDRERERERERESEWN
jgi:hypothetical protein